MKEVLVSPEVWRASKGIRSREGGETRMQEVSQRRRCRNFAWVYADSLFGFGLFVSGSGQMSRVEADFV